MLDEVDTCVQSLAEIAHSQAVVANKFALTLSLLLALVHRHIALALLLAKIAHSHTGLVAIPLVLVHGLQWRC